MLRSTGFAATLWCFTCLVTWADEPASAVVVASDWATASALPSLPVSTKLLVLFQDKDEAEEVIHTRALTMRHATHFIYLSGQESLLSAMYRERMTNQGAIAINLEKNATGRRMLRAPVAAGPIDALLATLSNQD